jgi:hypothetical protein
MVSDRLQVWSCGGGTQSAAIAALIIQGRLPKPDYAAMVDTGREKSSTWRFVDGVLRPRLAEVGCDLVIVPKSKYATVDLYSGNGDLLLPVYTTQNGEVSKMPGYCSNEWKRRPLQRWLRALGVEQCDVWIGFSTDELRRVRRPTEGWFQERYPLVFDAPMNRQNCKALVREVFGVEPVRSACWMCPHMRDDEWAEMRDNDPEDFAKACALGAEIHERDPHAYLHRSAQPLVQIADQIGATDQMGLLGCDSGMCFV